MSVQLIFLHGVANRRGPAYEKNVRKRDELFRKLLFGPDVTIRNPYWGEFGANPADGEYRSLPDYDNLDADERLNVGTAAAAGAPVALIELARDDFPETVDLIFAEVFAEAQADDRVLPDDIVQGANAAARYAVHEPNPGWLVEELTDDAFLDRLMTFATEFAAAQAPAAVSQVETLGIGSWLRKGARSLIDRVRNAGGRLVLARARKGLHQNIATFVGDVFSYLKNGAGREQIRERVREALVPALDSGAPTVLVAHSMGGVILADCLGDPDFRASVNFGNGRRIAALVTVGSQPGFFEELGLLAGGMAGASPMDVVDAWFNVYDELDALSFRASPLFDGAIDLRFSSRTGIADAHGAYFERVQFYQRLRTRLKESGVPVVDAP